MPPPGPGRRRRRCGEEAVVGGGNTDSDRPRGGTSPPLLTVPGVTVTGGGGSGVYLNATWMATWTCGSWMYGLAAHTPTCTPTGHGMPAVRSTFTVLLLLAISVVVAENCTSGLPPLIISGPPPHRSYNDAEPIKLVCRAHGSKPISFTWYKDGRRLDGNQVTVDGSLKMPRSSADTQGAYQCFASNPCGTAMSNITRLVRMYIQPRTSPSQTRSQNNSVGNKVTIQCDQLQGTATVSYYWHKLDSDQCRGQGRKVMENARINMDDNGSLAFSNLVATDQGVYKCFVLGGNGRHGAGCVRLTVDPNPHQHNLVPKLMYHSRSPQIGFEGEDFHLKCFFSGRPTPNVTFSRDGRALPRGRFSIDNVKHELTIRNPTVDDTGYYVCQGHNEAGQSDSVRIAVNIYQRPTLLDRPVSLNTSQGIRVVFKCRGKGVPEPNTTWFKNTQPLNIDNMNKTMTISVDKTELSITSVKLEDRGTYHCNVSNEHGYVLTAAYLNVDDNYVTNEIHVIEEIKGADKKDTENGEGDADKFTTSSVGYVIGAIVAAIILTVIVVLLVKRKKKSDSYNLGSPESYRLDTLGGDHAVGHRLLEEPQSPATQV